MMKIVFTCDDCGEQWEEDGIESLGEAELTAQKHHVYDYEYGWYLFCPRCNV